jgi:hypothetical protein
MLTILPVKLHRVICAAIGGFEIALWIVLQIVENGHILCRQTAAAARGAPAARCPPGLTIAGSDHRGVRPPIACSLKQVYPCAHRSR